MSEANQTPGVDESRAGTSRRQLIKRAAIVGGAVWVAPTVLNMSAAGAQTPTCYSFKTAGTCNCIPEADGAGTGCTPAPPPYACPPAGVITSISGCSGSTTFSIQLREGCTVQFLSVKAGKSCPTICSGGTGSNPGCGTSSLTYSHSPPANSHINIQICCTS